jgi:hypothetical protein
MEGVFMKGLLFIFIAAAILVILPVAGMTLSSRGDQEPARLTVIEKNMTSPTLEELGQKAGDPSNAEAPVEPLILGERKAQWI